MSAHSEKSRELEAIENEAAAWVVRQDRGLSPAELNEFQRWLGRDPRHSAAFSDQKFGWRALGRIAETRASLDPEPDPDILALPRRTVRPAKRSLTFAIAAAIAIGIGVLATRHVAPPPPLFPAAVVSPCERRLLNDGSVVDLNRGAEVTAQFTAAERRVRLERGEAKFTVTKDALRPFVVSVGNVEIRAVGTVFNVRLESSTIDVLVTEGSVKVAQPDVQPAAGAAAPPLVKAGECAIVSLAHTLAPPQIAQMRAEDLEQRLAWQPRLLDFDRAPLPNIVAEFNRHNPERLTIGDSELNQLRLSASFRSDNVEGFVRLMSANFHILAERRSATEVVLRKAR